MSRRLGFARGTLAASSPENELIFTASAEGTNRYGFSLNPKRWRLDNFNNNPVILWMHQDHMPPIGRAGVTKVDSSGLRLPVTFDRDDPFAAEVERKYRSGFLNAVSVGFDFVDKSGEPIRDWYNLSPEQIQTEAFYDLAEVSAVPVPADPQALIRQRHALAFDMGLRAPETDEDALKLLGFPLDSLRAPRAPESRTDPKPDDITGRLDRLEELMTTLAAKIGEPKTPAVEPEPEEEYEPEIVQGILSTIKL